MRTNKYVVAVGLLVVLAVAFGIIGTVAPPLAEESSPIQPQQGSSSDSVGHFMNPPTYDSGWVDVTDKCGQYFNITHNLNTTDVFIDIAGKQMLNEGEHQRYLGGTDYDSGWSRTYGGSQEDVPYYSVLQTGDGGYVLAGYTRSYGAGNSDFWLIKTDSTGSAQWNKTYGGTNYEGACSAVQTNDGGYAVVGYTGSFGEGDSDLYLVKTDSAGNMQWNKTYGGTGFDQAWSVIQTNDGGYGVVGETVSFGAGGYDFYLVKTDSTGNMEWNKTYGGTDIDRGFCVLQTGDGGYVLAGYTESYGAGNSDFWLIKTDSTGSAQWNKTYGGTGNERGASLVQASDGGFALAGSRGSAVPSSTDFYLVKTDSTGNMEWNKTYGGTSMDSATHLIQTDDLGYLVAGGTYSFGAGGSDFWLVRTDSAGRMQWNKTYGGVGSDGVTGAVSAVQTTDGAYAVAGSANSFGAGSYDFWLVKIGAESGLVRTGLTDKVITLYRGKTDSYWNYVHIRIWILKEPTWIYGDINMDGIVDAKDLYIIGRNYGQTLSLLSLTGIIAVAGIRTVKKRKQTS